MSIHQPLFSDLLSEPTPLSRVVDEVLPTLSHRPGHHPSTAPATRIVRPITAAAPVSSSLGLPPHRTSPWQRHGKTLLNEATTDPELAMRQAGLAWEVQRVDLRTADRLEPVPDISAIRRSDTGGILGVVGPDYTPLQNQQIFDVFRDLSRAGGDSGSVPYSIETAGSLQGGAVVWAMAHLPDLGIRIGDDESKTYLFISSGHIGNKLLTIAPTTVRIVCSNTLRMAEAQASQNRRKPGLTGGFTVKHLRGMEETLREIQDAYAATIRSQVLTKQAWQHLASKHLTEQLKKSFLISVFGKPGTDEADRAATIRKNREERIDAILASPTSQVRGTKDTAFSLLQAVVEHVDHDRVTRTADGGDAGESRLFSATFGSGADLKAKAWDAALELTGG